MFSKLYFIQQNIDMLGSDDRKVHEGRRLKMS